jgi:hypothetical protein
MERCSEGYVMYGKILIDFIVWILAILAAFFAFVLVLKIVEGPKRKRRRRD